MLVLNELFLAKEACPGYEISAKETFACTSLAEKVITIDIKI